MSGKLYEVWTKGPSWRAVTIFESNEQVVTIGIGTGRVVGSAADAIRLSGQEALFDSINPHEEYVTLSRESELSSALISWRQRCQHDGFAKFSIP